MPVVSSEITGQIDKANGRKLLMRAVDQTGKVWERRPNVPDANDDAATLAAWVVELDADLPNLEAQTESQRARNSLGLPAEHQTQAELDKATISLLMQIDDSLDFANTLLWFREFEVRAGANNNARASYLGVSNVNYGLVTDRYNQIEGIKAGLDGDEAKSWDEGEVW